MFSFLYYVTPDVRQRSFRWVTPGAAIAVTLWVLASYGFSLYLTRVADAGAIYGAFAGAIVLVAWLWLTNVALLFGAELNAELERESQRVRSVSRASQSIGLARWASTRAGERVRQRRPRSSAGSRSCRRSS